MTAITMNTPVSVDRIVTRMMRSAFNNLRTRAGTVQKEHKTHTDIKNLYELPPHLLRDIGISQDQITAEVSGTFHQRTYW